MTVSIRESIMVALVAVLETVPGIGAGNVFRDDMAETDTLPRLELLDDADDPVDQSTFGVDIQRAHVRVVGVVAGAGRTAAELAAMSAALDAIRGEVVKRVMANPQPVPGAIDMQFGECVYAGGEDASSAPTKGFGLSLAVEYHTKAGNPFVTAY